MGSDEIDTRQERSGCALMDGWMEALLLSSGMGGFPRWVVTAVAVQCACRQALDILGAPLLEADAAPLVAQTVHCSALRFPQPLRMTEAHLVRARLSVWKFACGADRCWNGVCLWIATTVILITLGKTFNVATDSTPGMRA